MRTLTFAAAAMAAMTAITLTATTAGAVSSPRAHVGTQTGERVSAAPSITLSPTSGPPGTHVTVKGTHFGAFEAIAITFDGAPMPGGSSFTNGSGSFTDKQASVPGTAQPGSHTVIAVGQHTGLAAGKTFTVRTNWAMFGDVASHGADDTTENVLSPSNVNGLGVDWTVPTRNPVGSSPAVYNGMAYVGSGNGDVYAINVATGIVKWTDPTGSPVSASPAATTINGHVWVFIQSGTKLYGIESTSAAPFFTVMWTDALNFFNASPTVANGNIYISNNPGNLYSINAATGAVNPGWPVATGGPDNRSTAAVANGSVYVGNDDGIMSSFNATTGAANWTFNANGAIASSPAVVNGVVYFASGFGAADPGFVYALNSSTGKPIPAWANNPFVTNGGGVFSAPAVADGSVYFSSFDGNVYDLNAGTGAQNCVPTRTGGGGSSPAVANGVVYVGGADNVWALDAATCGMLWSYATGGLVESSPAVADGVVYVGSDDGVIYAFHLPSAGARHQARGAVR
jgi:outer membrane protein assembly factor BamB